MPVTSGNSSSQPGGPKNAKRVSRFGAPNMQIDSVLPRTVSGLQKIKKNLLQFELIKTPPPPPSPPQIVSRSVIIKIVNK